jgi:protein tyrosine phosphatase
MLCKLVENNKDKCYQYWPDRVGTSRIYGDVDVSLHSIKIIKGVEGGVERSLTVRHDGEQTTVKHLQWQNWRDHGFPNSAEETMTLLRTARTFQKNKLQAMIVHCSAGIGRTGALVTIELALSKANANSRPLDMPRLVKLLRDQRVHSIQNDGQYTFVHFVVLTWLVSPRHPAPFVTRTAAIDQWLHDFRDLIARRRQDS